MNDKLALIVYSVLATLCLTCCFYWIFKGDYALAVFTGTAAILDIINIINICK